LPLLVYYISDMSAAAKKSKKSSAPKPVVIKPDKIKDQRSKVKGQKVKNKEQDQQVTAVKPALKVKDFRMLKVGLIILGIILAFCVLCALVFNSTNGSKLDSYIKSKDFQTYSKSLNQYLVSNKAIYPQTYTCQASLSSLWNPPTSPLSNKKEKLDVELARQLIDLKPKWEAASKSFPGYSNLFIFKVLPLDHSVFKRYQNAADLMDRTSALVNHTEDYTYYCPGFVYPGMLGFAYLESYSKTGTIIKDSPAVVTQHMQSLATTGNEFKDSKTPADWTATRTAYLAFLHKTLDDLTNLRNQLVKTPTGVNMSAQFATDKKDLEKTILEATKAGKGIGPDQKELAKLLALTTKN
jgi:hypothetical protein